MSRPWLDNPTTTPEPESPEKSPGMAPLARTRPVTALRPSEHKDLFVCRGTVRLKRTVRKPDGSEGIEILEIPVTTERLDRTAKEYEQTKRPTIPVKTTVVFPNSDLGQELGLTEKRVMEIAQPDDPDYQEALEIYNTNLMWAMVAEAIDIPLYLVDSGTDEERLAETTTEKVTALKQIGMTFRACTEVAKVIQGLREWSEEERKRFLGGF